MTYYVYAIAHDTPTKIGGPVKIGITGNPDSRMASLKTGSPNKVTFAFVLDVRAREAALELERAAHEHFRDRAMQGEWFDITPTEAGEFLTNTLEAWLFKGFARESWPLADLKKELWDCGVMAVRQRIAASRYIDAWEQQ